MIKARRISALLLAAALLLGCIPQALAVGEQIHSYEPIRTGDPRIDSLADELFKADSNRRENRRAKNSGRL